MLEQAYTPPETKYEVHIDELMKAIRGERFMPCRGLRRMKRKEIYKEELLDTAYLQLEDEQEYVVLTEAKLIGGNIIALENDVLTDYGIGFVFYRSIVPYIVLSQTKITGLYYWNSQSGDIGIAGLSQSGDIGIAGLSQSGNISVNGKSQIGNIKIASFSQSGNISMSAESRVSDISILEKSQIGNIKIDGFSQSGNIRINNYSQSGDTIIDSCSQTGSIEIINYSQSGKIRIVRNSKSGNICIRKNSQSGNLLIAFGGHSSDIRIAENKSAMAVSIIKGGQSGELHFNDAQLTNIKIEQNRFALHLNNTNFSLMKISDSLLTELDWQTGTKGELYIYKSCLLHLRVAHTELLKESLLSLSDTQLQYGVLQEVVVQGNLFLRKVGPPKSPADEWQKEFWNNKKALLEKQKQAFDNKVIELAEQYGPTPIFRITHSSLGKTEITGCDFSGFQFQYYNSNLLGCFITGTKLPKDNIFIYSPSSNTLLKNNEDNPELFEQKTAIYNQFKKIYENQGDVVEASWYHAKAMENQQALLQIAYKEAPGGKIKKLFGEKGFDLFGFWLNRVSNNHGESWRRAIRFVLLGSGIIYSLYYLSIHYHEPFGFGATGRFIGDYFSFLDITHRIDFHVPKEQLSGWSKFLDYFGKLVIGYGLYQLIAAFRRHGKKGG
jgi:hypothetical protein